MTTQVQTPAAAGNGEAYGFSYCELIPAPVEQFADGLPPGQLESLVVTSAKWANHSRIHYYFYDNAATDGETVRFTDGSTRFVTWVGGEDQKALVRKAFNDWKALGIGLDFEEVNDPAEAEVRIGFMVGNGSWSYVGTGVLDRPAGERTMNFGWDLRTDDNVALHEIGHTLGMPHEHQNPFAGIVWNESAVYASLAGPPNRWPREKTFNNILRKIDTSEVMGSQWDPDSIMHYPFGAGLITQPARYAQGLRPAGGLSAADTAWTVKFYPGKTAKAERTIGLARSEPLGLKTAEQADFIFAPPSTRRYTIQTTGESDTALVVFEDVDGKWRFVDADDDAGVDRNARLRLRLRKGRRYAIRIRMRFRDGASEPSVIVS